MQNRRRGFVVAVGLLTLNLVMLFALRAHAARRTEPSDPACACPPSSYSQTPVDGKSWKQDDMAIEGTATVRDVYSNRGFLIDRGELMFVYLDDGIAPNLNLKAGDRVYLRGSARCCGTFERRNPTASAGDRNAAHDDRVQADYLAASDVRPLDR